jgi:inorganic pyrophosphatase
VAGRRRSYGEAADRRPVQEELEKFFIATDELEDKKLKILGWKGPKVAVQTIKAGGKSFAKDA